MIDSGIKDISLEALEKFADRFMFEESEEAAENKFMAILDESIRAFLAVIMDRFHIWAGYFRK